MLKPWHQYTNPNPSIKEEDYYNSSANILSSDILFAIQKDIIITPIEYFEKEKSCYDQHLDLEHPFTGKMSEICELLEATFFSPLSVNKTRELPLKAGFMENEEFTKLVGGILFKDKLTNKLSTEICKKEICKEVLNQFQNIITQFVSEPGLKEKIKNEATLEKSWKRRGKRKVNEYDCSNHNLPKGSTLRDFDCVPFDDQLRAYVYTDPTDTQILKIIIQGE